MKMVKKEFSNLFKNKILLISMIAIIFIPILYAGVFGKSVWDPTKMAKNLPVAVVNEDIPGEMMGQKVNVGEQLVAQLKDNKSLKWEFVDKETAKKGMEDLYYYMIVTIPKDFSKNAETIIDKEPKEMELTYTTNGSLNYIGQDIAMIGATELESQIRESVTKSYIEAALAAGKKALPEAATAAKGIDELAAGSEQLDEGLETYTTGVGSAYSGSTQLADGTATLAGSVGPLEAGVTQLNTGSKTLSAGLNEINEKVQPLGNKVQSVQGGLDDLVNGTRELEVALQNVEANLDASSNTVLDNDMKNIMNNIDHLLTNSNELNSVSFDAAQLSNDLVGMSNTAINVRNNVTVASNKLKQDVGAIVNGYDDSIIDGVIKGQLIQAIEVQIDDLEGFLGNEVEVIQTDLTNVSAKANELARQATMVSELTGGIAQNTVEIKQSAHNVEQGIADISSALDMKPHSSSASQVAQGLENTLVEANTLVDEVPLALAGVNELASGSQQLTDGIGEIYTSMPTLVSGVDQLDSGASQLNAGLDELNENSPALMSGIGQIEAGAEEMAEAVAAATKVVDNLSITDKNIEMFIAPTNLKNIEYSKVKNAGQAMSPFIMSMALFIGCLAFNVIFPLRSISMKNQTSNDWWMSKVAVAFLVSTAMGLVQGAIMQMIGLPIDSVGKFYMASLATAWSIMFLTMFLTMAFGNPGLFVAIVLLAFQLGGSGGMLPLPLQSSFYNAINPYLPMTYSVFAYKEALSGGIGTGMYNKSIIILLVITIVSAVLMAVAMHTLQKKQAEGKLTLVEE